jgi:hypothetical protein
MVLIHSCETAARDSTPPRVDEVGVGRRAAPSVPLLILLASVVSVEQDGATPLRSEQAGWEADGTPAVEMV